MKYRSGIDRQVGMYLAFLVVTIVGALASLAIIRSIDRTEWSNDSRYDALIANPTGAAIPDRSPAR